MLPPLRMQDLRNNLADESQDKAQAYRLQVVRKDEFENELDHKILNRRAPKKSKKKSKRAKKYFYD